MTSAEAGLSARLRALAATRGADPAIILPERTYDWREYDAAASAFAHRLRESGVERYDVVAVLLPDGFALHAALMGCERAGVVALGLGARAGLREILHLASASGAVALLSAPVHKAQDAHEIFARLREGVPSMRRHLVVAESDEELIAAGAGKAELPDEGLPPEALFLLNSTSGTTGLPKCVAHNQARWFAFHDMAVAAGALDEADVFLAAPPAPFGFGIWTSHVTPLLLGAPVALLPKFDPALALSIIERHRVTVLAAVSTQFIMMLNSPAFAQTDFASLRVLFAGGEAIPEARARQFEEQTGAAVLNIYGSNETGALSCTTLADPRSKRLTTAGRPLASMRLRLFGPDGADAPDHTSGRPAGKGPLLSLGYHNDPAANAALFTRDGWMLMDDIVEIDGDGYLRVVGRIGDFVIRGGKNISCAAVEEIALQHPAIALAAAIGVPDAVFGERVALFVALQEQAPAPSLAEVARHFRDCEASTETIPEYLIVRSDLPRASGGKIAKGELRDLARMLLAPECGA